MKTITCYELLELNGDGSNAISAGFVATENLAASWVATDGVWMSYKFKVINVFESLDELKNDFLAKKVDAIASGLSASDKMLLREAFEKGLL